MRCIHQCFNSELLYEKEEKEKDFLSTTRGRSTLHQLTTS